MASEQAVQMGRGDCEVILWSIVLLAHEMTEEEERQKTIKDLLGEFGAGEQRAFFEWLMSNLMYYNGDLFEVSEKEYPDERERRRIIRRFVSGKHSSFTSRELLLAIRMGSTDSGAKIPGINKRVVDALGVDAIVAGLSELARIAKPLEQSGRWSLT